MKLGHSRAFSLVEVVLALGVAAFAIIAVLGIFPTALSTNRSSANEARAAQLVRAITGTIDSQCATFSNINCYGASLDLTALTTGSAPTLLYASYASPNLPVVSTSQTDAIYTIQLRFNNNPSLTVSNLSGGPNLGTGKINLIEIRILGKDQSEGATEYFYLARNKG